MKFFNEKEANKITKIKKSIYTFITYLFEIKFTNSNENINLHMNEAAPATMWCDYYYFVYAKRSIAM